MITLSDSTLGKLAELNGGRKPATELEVVQLVESMLAFSVDGAVVTLEPEDAQALKDHFEEFSYGSYDEYVSDSVVEALHLFLWGSTRGKLVYN